MKPPRNETEPKSTSVYDTQEIPPPSSCSESPEQEQAPPCGQSLASPFGTGESTEMEKDAPIWTKPPSDTPIWTKPDTPIWTKPDTPIWTKPGKPL